MTVRPDLKCWLQGADDEEDPEKGVMEGLGDTWRLFVRLLQAIWHEGKIPRQLLWIVVVLIPKGGGGYRGIGLMEPMWKTLEVIMDRRLIAGEFHECLHGFVSHKGTGTAVIEAKLAQ